MRGSTIECAENRPESGGRLDTEELVSGLCSVKISFFCLMESFSAMQAYRADAFLPRLSTDIF